MSAGFTGHRPATLTEHTSEGERSLESSSTSPNDAMIDHVLACLTGEAENSSSPPARFRHWNSLSKCTSASTSRSTETTAALPTRQRAQRPGAHCSFGHLGVKGSHVQILSARPKSPGNSRVSGTFGVKRLDLPIEAHHFHPPARLTRTCRRRRPSCRRSSPVAGKRCAHPTGMNSHENLPIISELVLADA